MQGCSLAAAHCQGCIALPVPSADALSASHFRDTRTPVETHRHRCEQLQGGLDQASFVRAPL